MSWLLVFLGFCLLIVLHEGGHYVAAKATGMRVEKFFLFLGPKLVSFKRGETEYGIAAIPLGGYAKISGMNPEEELPPEVEPRAYSRQPVWKRIVVVAAGPAVNIALAFAIFFIAFLFYSQRPTQAVGEVNGGAPAATVLRPGDRIRAVDGRSYPALGLDERLERFGKQVASHECPGRQVNGCKAATPVKLEVLRDGSVRTIFVRPEYDREYGRTLIGFSYADAPEDVGAGTALDRAADSMWLVTHRTASIVSRIFEAEQRKQLSSVVGISDVGHQTVEVGVFPSLVLLAIVSLSLGLFNLLPILPLDGGHIFWSLLEKLRGKPVSLRVMERATVVGIALVVLLFFIGLNNDIGRLTGEGFNVR
jgi:regulator of sigma E protease